MRSQSGSLPSYASVETYWSFLTLEERIRLFAFDDDIVNKIRVAYEHLCDSDAKLAACGLSSLRVLPRLSKGFVFSFFRSKIYTGQGNSKAKEFTELSDDVLKDETVFSRIRKVQPDFLEPKLKNSRRVREPMKKTRWTDLLKTMPQSWEGLEKMLVSLFEQKLWSVREQEETNIPTNNTLTDVGMVQELDLEGLMSDEAESPRKKKKKKKKKNLDSSKGSIAGDSAITECSMPRQDSKATTHPGGSTPDLSLDTSSERDCDDCAWDLIKNKPLLMQSKKREEKCMQKKQHERERLERLSSEKQPQVDKKAPLELEDKLRNLIPREREQREQRELPQKEELFGATTSCDLTTKLVTTSKCRGTNEPNGARHVQKQERSTQSEDERCKLAHRDRLREEEQHDRSREEEKKKKKYAILPQSMSMEVASEERSTALQLAALKITKEELQRRQRVKEEVKRKLALMTEEKEWIEKQRRNRKERALEVCKQKRHSRQLAEMEEKKMEKKMEAEKAEKMEAEKAEKMEAEKEETRGGDKEVDGQRSRNEEEIPEEKQEAEMKLEEERIGKEQEKREIEEKEKKWLEEEGKKEGVTEKAKSANNLVEEEMEKEEEAWSKTPSTLSENMKYQYEQQENEEEMQAPARLECPLVGDSTIHNTTQESSINGRTHEKVDEDYEVDDAAAASKCSRNPEGNAMHQPPSMGLTESLSTTCESPTRTDWGHLNHCEIEDEDKIPRHFNGNVDDDVSESTMKEEEYEEDEEDIQLSKTAPSIKRRWSEMTDDEDEDVIKAREPWRKDEWIDELLYGPQSSQRQGRQEEALNNRTGVLVEKEEHSFLGENKTKNHEGREFVAAGAQNVYRIQHDGIQHDKAVAKYPPRNEQSQLKPKPWDAYVTTWDSKDGYSKSVSTNAPIREDDHSPHDGSSSIVQNANPHVVRLAPWKSRIESKLKGIDDARHREVEARENTSETKLSPTPTTTTKVLPWRSQRQLQVEEERMKIELKKLEASPPEVDGGEGRHDGSYHAPITPITESEKKEAFPSSISGSSSSSSFCRSSCTPRMESPSSGGGSMEEAQTVDSVEGEKISSPTTTMNTANSLATDDGSHEVNGGSGPRNGKSMGTSESVPYCQKGSKNGPQKTLGGNKKREENVEEWEEKWHQGKDHLTPSNSNSDSSPTPFRASSGRQGGLGNTREKQRAYSSSLKALLLNHPKQPAPSPPVPAVRTDAIKITSKHDAGHPKHPAPAPTGVWAVESRIDSKWYDDAGGVDDIIDDVNRTKSGTLRGAAGNNSSSSVLRMEEFPCLNPSSSSAATPPSKRGSWGDKIGWKMKTHATINGSAAHAHDMKSCSSVSTSASSDWKKHEEMRDASKMRSGAQGQGTSTSSPVRTSTTVWASTGNLPTRNQTYAPNSKPTPIPSPSPSSGEDMRTASTDRSHPSSGSLYTTHGATESQLQTSNNTTKSGKTMSGGAGNARPHHGPWDAHAGKMRTEAKKGAEVAKTRRQNGPITLKGAPTTSNARANSLLDAHVPVDMEMDSLENALRLGQRIDGKYVMVKQNPQLVTQLTTLALCRSLRLQPDARGNVHVDPTELIARIQGLGRLPIAFEDFE